MVHRAYNVNQARSSTWATDLPGGKRVFKNNSLLFLATVRLNTVVELVRYTH
jgi:hypothetical protein